MNEGVQDKKKKGIVWINNKCEWKTIWAQLLFYIEEYLKDFKEIC